MTDDNQRNNMGGVKGILTNLSWSASEQIVRMALGFAVSVTLARHLGPEPFGTYTFIQSIVAMASTIMPLAADQIVQRRLLMEPERAHVIFGAACVLRVAGCVAAGAAAILVISFIKSGQPYLWVYCTVAILALASQSLDVIVVWFQSQLRMRDVFWARTPPFFLISAIRGLLVAAAASFSSILWTIAADSAVTALGLLVAFKRSNRLPEFVRVRLADIHSLAAESWPVLVSLVMAGVYFRLDALMISALKGDTEVGLYSVAAKISELGNFLPVVFLGSIMPLLIKAKQEAPQRYHDLLAQAYAAIGLTGFVMTLVMSLFATPICVLLFGPQYYQSGHVLAIHVWSTVPVFLGLVVNGYLVIEGQGRIVLVRTAIALAANFFINALLIPAYGAVGAAVANVAAATIALLCLLLFATTRAHIRLMVQSISLSRLRYAIETVLSFFVARR